MEHVVVLGSERAAQDVARAAAALPLAGPPSTCIVVAAGDHDQLPFALRTAAHNHHGLIVVAVSEPPERVLDDVLQIADDYVEWGADAMVTVRNRLIRWQEVHGILHGPLVRQVAAGYSPAHLAALSDVVELARYSVAPVLLTGETGTGKEVAARLLHDLSPRSSAAFCVLDGAALQSAELASDQLFGHERGAFTGAMSSRMGAVALADGGTLFLDEVGELPLQVQAELLRVLEEGSYKRVGGDRWLRSDFRLVCATNRHLDAEVSAGRFRQDLYHRIAGGIVHLRPLRERRDDIAALFATFLGIACKGTAPQLTTSVSRLLQARDYPGNVRDLRQLAIRVAARHTGDGPVTLGDLPKADRRRTLAEPAPPGHDASLGGPGATSRVHAAARALLEAGHSLPQATRIVGDAMVEIALGNARGSTRAAARQLGVSERAVQLRRASRRADRAED
jgi:transcriptional regulator with GAF, ATPase, and Fis domain